MVTLEWSCERSDGVTLVSLVVGADRPCRVRIENRLDGPVWPPRRRGRPVAGWDGDAFEGSVPADGRLTVGYATPARPADPPAEVVSTTPVEEDDESARLGVAGPSPAVDSTPAGVVRELGDPLVPRDSVPIPEPDQADRSTTTATRSTPGDGTGPESASAGDRPGSDAPAESARVVVPGAVRAWLRDVEERLDAATRRPESGDDGPDDAGLGAAVAADRRALERVHERVDELLARADGTRRGGGRPEPTGRPADGAAGVGGEARSRGEGR